MADKLGYKGFAGTGVYTTSVITDNHPARIECMDVWRDRLVVGCTEGHLIIWEIYYNIQSKTYTMKEVKYQRGFSKKPITQLNVVETHNMLLTLSDGVISVHSLPELRHITTISKSKGCYFYVLDEQKDGNIRLGIVLKKKILLTEWIGTDFQEIKELAVPDTVKTLSFAGQSLCVGFKSEFNLINIDTGVMTYMFPSGKASPLSMVLSDSYLLLTRDNVSIYLYYDGKPARNRGINWAESPTGVYYAYPYLLGATPRQIEVKRLYDDNNGFVQNIGFKELKAVAVANKQPYSEQVKRVCDVVYIANKTQIYRLDMIPLSVQVDRLVSNGAYDDARLLVELVCDEDLPDKKERSRQITMLIAYNQFCEGKPARAIELFLALDVHPLQVLALYPNMLPPALAAAVKHPVPPENLPRFDTPAGAKENTKLVNACRALVQFLITHRNKLLSGRNPDGTAAEPPNTYKAENQVDWNSTTDLAVILDTCLLKAYLIGNDKLVSSLLRLQNYCHVRECETVLLAKGKHADLIWLYKGKNLHAQALKLLKQLGESPPVPDQPNLSGPLPTVEYLKGLNKEHLPLIFEYSKWVLLQDPDAGLNIFTFDRKPEHALPPDQVLAFLKSVAPKDPVLTQKLVVVYLEHLIFDKNDRTKEFHNELVYQYFDIVLSLKRQQPDRRKVQIAGSEPGPLGIIRTKLVEFLEQSEDYDPSKMLSRYNYAFSEDGLYEERAILLSKNGEHALALKEYVHKLQDFAQAEQYCMKHYNPDDERGKDVYYHLLHILTKDKDIQDPEACLAFAFEILNRHFAEIDIPKALELLPPETPIKNLCPIFTNVWRSKNMQKRESAVLLNIRRSEMMKVKHELWKLRSVVIKITDETTCSVCNKRMGDALFVYHTNTMEVVHYTCYNRQLAKKQREEAPRESGVSAQPMR